MAIVLEMEVMKTLADRASYLICRCLRGTDGKTPLSRQRGYESSSPLLEFGEQIWAKPMKSGAWRKKTSLAARWTGCTWCGISQKTGEHFLILDGGDVMIKARTVKRRPIEDRWSSEAVLEIKASQRRPEVNKT